MSRRFEYLERIERIFERLLRILEEILYYVRPHQRTSNIAIRFSGASPMPNNVLVLNVGQTSIASIVPLLADGVTPSGGIVTGVSFSFSDPSATVTLNPDGATATCAAVAASTNGPVSGTATCTVTDTDSVVSTWTQAFTILVNSIAPPAQITQSVAVQFSTPA
jgi:hypothetical protein